MSDTFSINYNLFSYFPEIKNQDYFNDYLNFLKESSLCEEDSYIERHHIVPKCYLKSLSNKEKDNNNIIKLSAKNHYIAHKLLYLSFQDYYMTDSFFRMTHSIQNGNISWIDENLYSQLRKDYSEQVSAFFKGKTTVYNPNDDDSYFIRVKKEEIFDYLDRGYLLGTSPKFKEKVSKSHKGYIMPEEYKKIRGKGTRGRIWVYNIIDNKFFRKRLKPGEDIPDGYKVGMGWNIENPASKAYTSLIGKHWYNDGKIQFFSDSCPKGFKPGRLPFKKK